MVRSTVSVRAVFLSTCASLRSCTRNRRQSVLLHHQTSLELTIRTCRTCHIYFLHLHKTTSTSILHFLAHTSLSTTTSSHSSSITALDTSHTIITKPCDIRRTLPPPQRGRRERWTSFACPHPTHSTMTSTSCLCLQLVVFKIFR